MKAWWVALEARIDGLTLRERVFLFIACIMGLVALGYTFWLAPIQKEYQQVSQRFAAQTAELENLQTELKTGSKPNTETLALRQEIDGIQGRIDAVNRDIQASTAASSGSTELEQVLVQFLRRQEGLTLVSIGNMRGDGETSAQTAMQTVPPSAADPTAATAPAAPALSATMALAAMRRSGMELRVSGPYGELVRYVKTLETAMPHLRWGPMQLSSDKQKNLLSLQVYLVGVQP